MLTVLSGAPYRMDRPCALRHTSAPVTFAWRTPVTDQSYKRSQALQIYLKEGIAEEKVLLDIWEACIRLGYGSRKQNVFRDIMLAGLQALLETDKFPEDLIDECGLDRLMERKIRRKHRASVVARGEANVPPVPPFIYPYPHPYPHLQPLPPQPPGYSGYVPPPVPSEPSAVRQRAPEDVPADAPSPVSSATPQQRVSARAKEMPQSTAANPEPPKREQDTNTQEATKKKPKFDLM